MELSPWPSRIVLLYISSLGVLHAAEITPEHDAAASEVVVTAGALPGSVTSPSIEESEAEKMEVPGGVTIRNADEAKRGRASNFEDLLKRAPGLFLQTNSGGEVSKISIRGSGIESEDEPVGVMVLLDGLNYNQGDGEVLLEDLDISAVRYAEIFRGAAAFKYGSITLGGAINLVPVTGYDADRFGTRLEAGSYDYFRAQLATGGVQGSLDYFASLTARQRGGYRVHSDEDMEILFSDIGWKLGEQLENRLYFTLDRTARDLPGGLTQTEMNNDPQQADPDAVEQDWNKSWSYVRLADRIAFKSDLLDFTAGAFWFHRDLTERGFFSPEFRAGIESYYSDNYGGNVNLVLRQEIFGRRTIITAGGSPQFEYESAQNDENLGGHPGRTTARGENISMNAPFYFEAQHYLAERFSLLVGAQVIYAQRRFIDRFPSDSAGDQSHRQDFFSANPKLGAVYELDAATQIFANFSRSWQPPTLDKLVSFSDGPDSTITYHALAPQRAWSAELGTRGHRGPIEWELSIYDAQVRDELLELNDARGNDIGTTNVRRSIHRGVEASLGLEVLNSILVHGSDEQSRDRISLQQTYTLNDFHFDDDMVYRNNRIAGIPLHFYEMQLLYETPGGFYAGPNLRCNLTRYPVDQANTLYASPYALLGFKIGYRQKKGWSVFVEAMNLTGQRYAASVDAIADARADAEARIFHPGDGRSVYGGLSWSW